MNQQNQELMLQTFSKRREEIKKEYESGKTLEEVGKIFGITRERVRQIVTPSLSFFCKKHKTHAKLPCEGCEIAEAYLQYLESCDILELAKQVKHLREKNRSKFMVLKRYYMIKFLKEKKNLSTVKIGKLLNRDHTSIMHALNIYGKKIN